MSASVIFYHPEAYSVVGKTLMGRHSAGESFLAAYMKYASQEVRAIFTDSEGAEVSFKDSVLPAFGDKKITFFNRSNFSSLHKFGCLFYPGPTLGPLARHRSVIGDDSFSLCGITHTTSSLSAMNSITELLGEPIYPWDALICTSNAVKKHVDFLLDRQYEWVRHKFGATRCVKPSMPVIPLGIHADRFEYSEKFRQDSREKLNASDKALVVLFVGRLSFHAKAHPLAMYQALEACARKTRRELILIECGWYANDYIKNAFLTASASICPQVRHIFLDGREQESRDIAWASADIFCSLSDNVQETFGLVPLEAMAVGLPVVVSDWNGYRDTVRDGLDGFLIPTQVPSPGLGNDLSARHVLGLDSYDRYCGYSSSFTAVDVGKLIDALIRLIDSPDLRKEMGESGRSRVYQLFHWPVVLRSYEALWDELEEIRKQDTRNYFPANSQRRALIPQLQDPFLAFDAYPSGHLSGTSRFALVDSSIEQSRERLQIYLSLEMVSYALAVLPSVEEIDQMLICISSNSEGVMAQEIIGAIEKKRRPLCLRALNWLYKLNILKVL